MPDVVGMSVDELQDELEAAGHDGDIMFTSNTEQGDVKTESSEFYVVTQSPWAYLPVSSSVTVGLTKMGVPEDQTFFFESISGMEQALEYAGVTCVAGLPTSEAVRPDEVLDCTKSLVLSRWDLDTESSKAMFAAQKEYYSGAGNGPSLFGQNWIYHGDLQTVQKMQEFLGGTIVSP